MRTLALVALSVVCLAGCSSTGSKSDAKPEPVIYVDGTSGAQHTYKQVVNTFKVTPDMTSCEEALSWDKQRGDKFPAGEAEWLKACKEGKAKQ